MRLLNLCQFLILFFAVEAAAFGSDRLQEKIDRLLSSAGLSQSKTSIQIVSLPEGEVLYELNPDLALNPASNAKLVTAAAALHELGPDFTFETDFYSDSRISRDGRLRNLWIKGFGDPLFITEELESIVKEFRAGGLREIDGNLFVDDTYFDRYNLITYLSDIHEKVYSVVTGPLSFNFNSIEIKARPASRLGDQPILALEPPTRYLTIQNEAKTSRRGSLAMLEAEVTPSDGGELKIRGSLPRTIREYSFRRGILDPATYTGTVVMEALERSGVKLRGSLRREAVPGRALKIFSHTSPPLRVILKGMGKFSNNFIAEQLVKSLGALHFGPPGSTEKGLKVLRNYLASLGIPTHEFTLENGSGLSKSTRLSSAQLIQVLRDIYAQPWSDDLISSLSIAGLDGTLRTRMQRSILRGKVLAKTGTLNGVSALSGYVTEGRRPFAFSFVFNDFPLSLNGLSRIEEQILEMTFANL